MPKQKSMISYMQKRSAMQKKGDPPSKDRTLMLDSRPSSGPDERVRRAPVDKKAEIAALNKKYRSGEMDYQTMKAESQKLRSAKEQKQIKKQAGNSKGFSGKSSFRGAAQGSMLCKPSGGSCSPRSNKTLGGKF